MNLTKYSPLLLLIVATFGCGKSSDLNPNSPSRVVNRGEPNNLRYNWSVAEKTCDGVAVSMGMGSYFILSGDLIARVDTTTDTETLSCKTVYTYFRNIAGSSSDQTSYLESGILRSGSAKKTCRVKQDGNVSSMPTTTTLAFPSEEMTYHMKGTDSAIAFEFRGSAECSGILAIKMKSKN